MPLKNELTKFSTASPIIVSYDYTDFEEGTGIVVFQGYGNLETTNTTYGLSKDVTRGNPISTSVDTYFYASAFNTSKTIKGTARIEGAMGMSSAQGEVSGTGKIEFTFQHWDGSTATNIGSATTETISIGSDTQSSKIISMNIALTEKHFQEGDILRLYANLTHTGANTWFKLACDPLNADVNIGTPVHPDWVIDSATYPTTLKILIPFKLNQ